MKYFDLIRWFFTGLRKSKLPAAGIEHVLYELYSLTPHRATISFDSGWEASEVRGGQKVDLTLD